MNIAMNRIDELKRLHMSVFMGREDYIPLIVNPPCPGRPQKSDYWENVVSAVEKDFKALQPKVEVSSDWIPTVNVSLYQNIAVPSLFGAEIIHPQKSDPICKTCFDSLDEACASGVPSAQGTIVEKMLGDLKMARHFLDGQFSLSFVVVSSPFDLAVLLLGGEFLTGLIAEPDKALQFLFNLSSVSLQLIEMVNEKLGYGKDGFVKSRGLFSPGYRLSCDAIVNYSPDHLREFVLPVIAKFKDRLGPMYVHFCTEPALSSHILPVLIESDDVFAVDNWQGPEIFIGEDSRTQMQSKIAVVGDIDVQTPEKMAAFFNMKSVKKVPRKGGRGLVMTTGAKSIEEGRRIYGEWKGWLSQ